MFYLCIRRSEKRSHVRIISKGSHRSMLTLILPTSTFTHFATEREYLRLRSCVIMPESVGDGQLRRNQVICERREGV